MKSTRTYHEVTQQPITPKVQDWINELVERNGDDAVARQMVLVGQAGNIDRFLEKVRKALAIDAAKRISLPPPTEVDTWTLLAIVRGEIQPPDGPWIYDAGKLGDADYAVVLAWTERRMFGDRAMPAVTA